MATLKVNTASLLDLSSAAVTDKKMTIETAIAAIRGVFSFGADVSANGIIAEVTRSIIECKDYAAFVDALIIASRSKTKTKIFLRQTRRTTPQAKL